jgi:hypothetical protein
MNRRTAKKAHAVKGGTSDANRVAIAILEVLAGVRSPIEAAEALEISVPRYYQLETRALDAMVSACEPRPKGRQRSAEGQIASLQREVDRAQRECARQQALARVAQRSVGLKALPPAASKGDKGRKKRRPTIRALKAADALRKNARLSEGQSLQQHGNGSPADQESVGHG